MKCWQCTLYMMAGETAKWRLKGTRNKVILSVCWNMGNNAKYKPQDIGFFNGWGTIFHH
jgi:RNase P subunit RPR2